LPGVHGDHGENGACHQPAAEVIEFQQSLQLIIAKWPHLSDRLRQANLTIVRLSDA
jgi:hypothetical protein